MNDTILQLNRLAETWSDMMWRASWQGGLALLLVWGVCRALKSIPAAAKVWLWRLAWLKFIVALASPTFLDVPLLKTREARNVERGTRNEFVPSQESTTEVFAATVPVVIRPSVKGCLFLIWI